MVPTTVPTVVPTTVRTIPVTPAPTTPVPTTVLPTDQGILPRLSLNPVNASIVEGSVKAYDIVLNRAPSGISGYEIVASVANTSVASITGGSFPGWAVINQSTNRTSGSLRLSGADLSGKVEDGAAGVVLGTITLKGERSGSTKILLTVDEFDDDDGEEIEAKTDQGTLTVTRHIAPFPGQTASPKDLNADGVFEDLNGNGKKEFSDVVLFFLQMDWIRSGSLQGIFDFNRNGRIDFHDAVLLFQKP
jgi:PKD repeat protein